MRAKLDGLLGRRWLQGRLAGGKTIPVQRLGGKFIQKFRSTREKHAAAALILVDIPIGLRQGSRAKRSIERQERRCDKEARKLLGPRRASVFRVPCRPAVYAESYDQAIAKNEKLTGTRIFKATWNIVAKIREVDEFLSSNPEARESIREINPELCFWSLNGCRPLQYPKKTETGFRDRLKLLQEIYPPSEEIVESVNYAQKEVKRDDILDALAAAITAKIGFDKLSCLPPQPERDSQGLPMEMVYFLCSWHQSQSQYFDP